MGLIKVDTRSLDYSPYGHKLLFFDKAKPESFSK